MTGSGQYIVRVVTGDYIGEGGTFNSDRSYAKPFSSFEDAKIAGKATFCKYIVEDA